MVFWLLSFFPGGLAPLFGLLSFFPVGFAFALVHGAFGGKEPQGFSESAAGGGRMTFAEARN
jgi:hypothetical protein